MTSLTEKQRAFFASRVTLDLAYRRAALKKLRAAILSYEPRLAAALQADLGKSATESYMSEIGMCLGGIREALRKLRRWARPRRVPTPLAQFPSQSRVYAEPYGVCLLMSPWNYPVLLTLDPLVSALAAGNTCIVKPSELAPHCSAVLAEMLASVFPQEYVAVLEGGPELCNELLKERFDYIFFTGGGAIGKLVMRAAAEHLTPLTLELGGKSPCIVTQRAELPVAARRIAFGKILNAGQTCVAPDYLLIHESLKGDFVRCFREAVEEMLGAEPLQNEAYPHIINERHFSRLLSLMQGSEPLCGGLTDAASLRIEPTLLDVRDRDDACMQQEIFGPILPVLTFGELSDAEREVQSRPRPLACYIFSQAREEQERLLQSLSFGGGCINDTIIHLAVPGLPFGGVGDSGMGAYHGKAGFDAFTHAKSVLRKATWLDLPFRYQPYSDFKQRILRLFLR